MMTRRSDDPFRHGIAEAMSEDAILPIAGNCKLVPDILGVFCAESVEIGKRLPIMGISGEL
jgi:hypothetical protein